MLAEECILETVNLNQQKFEQHRDLVNEAFHNYNSNLPDNQDAYGQVGNDETAEAFYNEDPNEEQNRRKGSSPISGIGKLHIPSDDHIARNIQNVNRKTVYCSQYLP